MTALRDDAVAIAQRVGRAYCRDLGIPPQYAEDCQNEGIAEALRVLGQWDPDKGALITFLYPWIRGAISSYWSKQQNGGMGGKDASPRLVSLQDEVVGAHDFDGDPLTYEDIVSYAEPPLGYGDPIEELLNEEEEAGGALQLLPSLLETLSSADRALIVRYFGLGGPEATQQELALEEDVSNQAIGKRIQRILKKLREEYEGGGWKLQVPRHN